MPALRRLLTPRRAVHAVAWTGIWLALTVLVGTGFFLQSSREIVLASHDAVVRPTMTGYIEVRTGPVLPDVRFSSGQRIGVDVYLGKTEAASTEELIERYAVIASQPEGQRAKVQDALVEMAVGAALRGAVVALTPMGLWFLVGRRRRREIGRRLRSPVLAGVGGLALVAGLVVWEPWESNDPTLEEVRAWQPLADFIPGVSLPPEVQDLELRGDVTTTQTRRLVESAIDTYEKSQDFYQSAAEEAADLEVRVPEEGDTVVTLVSDRHDNIGMDRVARAIGDAAGATAVFDAGDDTSTGQPWEAFSLDSVNEAFEDVDRWGVAGNHDNGTFVSSYLADRGWTMLAGESVDGPGGLTLLGVDDPRSSGLGSWRDETGLSYQEVAERLADVACDAPVRIGTMLVHDATLGRPALERGCTDLVVGGHLHQPRGPEQYVGPAGEIGYSYTTGTTGGAAYAIAIGSKPRRSADVTLLTYRDGRPFGLQGVTLQTDGVFVVGDFLELDYDEVEVVEPELPTTSP